MPRDTVIAEIFTTADDAMQGLWGIHNYVCACIAAGSKDLILKSLPKGSFMLTHEWARSYDPKELMDGMSNAFEFVHCRQSLTVLVSIFEAAASRFIARLLKLGSVSHSIANYKKQLEWVFDTVKGTKAGSTGMLARLPKTCGDLDNARRLRNACAHNNGKYDDRYEKDAINNGWVQVHLEPDYEEFRRNKWCPIFLTNERFECFFRSHVEVLHILHNTLQRHFFGQSQDYNYDKEGKSIEWYRLLSGKKTVQM